jgi:hypothetical protein
MSRSFETRLDDALADAALADAPEVTKLVAVARELQVLAPTPQPRLAEGRHRFLNEAARLVQPPHIFERMMVRPARTFGFAAVLVLLVLGVWLIAESSMFVGHVPGVSSSTLTMSPTDITTPTGTTAARMNLVPLAPTLVTHLCSPQPKPVPTPMSPRD